MDNSTWPGTSIADMPEEAFDELFDLLEERAPGDRGGQLARIATFLGFWRPVSGANLRIGRRRDSDFVAADDTEVADLVKVGEPVNLSLRQVYVPDLPHDRCVLQLAWRASHRFDDQEDVEIAHTTSCDAATTGAAAAIGLPIFSGLNAKAPFVLNIGVYAMTDRASQPILDLLASPALRGGLSLAGKFNPAFGMTVPYLEAAVTGLTKLSRRNFKLANWRVGFSIRTGPVPLAAGEYILLDGVIRLGRDAKQLAWSDLKWDNDRQSPMYSGTLFRNPYLMLSVNRAQGPVATP
jgi:hypothetical protein